MSYLVCYCCLNMLLESSSNTQIIWVQKTAHKSWSALRSPFRKPVVYKSAHVDQEPPAT